jgi:hypothetical protein
MTDFKNYAKNLSWLIEEPLQESQQLLARIYGYSGLRELQLDLAKAGEPSNPSPFGEQNRILEKIAELKGIENFVELDSRDWTAAKEIELFSWPAKHYSAFRLAKLKIQILEGSGPDGGSMPAEQFASLDYREHDEYAYDQDEAFIPFTRLGRAIFNAVSELLEDRRYLSIDEANERFFRALEIQRAFPNNPWPRAQLIGRLLESREWSIDSTSNWGDRVPSFDEGNGKILHDDPFANECLIAVQLFEELYGDLGQIAPHHSLVTGSYDYGADCWYWPNILGWAAQRLIDLNDGGSAYQLLKKYHNVIGAPYPHLRDIAGMMILNEEDPYRVRMTYRSEQAAHYPNENMTHAVKLAEKGDKEWAVRFFALAIVGNIEYAEMFHKSKENQYWASDIDYEPMDEEGDAEQFIRLTSRFWERNPSIRSFFRSLCTDRVLELAMKCKDAADSVWEWNIEEMDYIIEELGDDEVGELLGEIRREAGLPVEE